MNQNDSLVGLFAISSAGHDKGKLFIIVSDGTEYVGIADGKSRTIENPKRKNIKHLRIIKDEKAGKPVSNEEVKRAIRLRLSKGNNICPNQT